MAQVDERSIYLMMYYNLRNVHLWSEQETSLPIPQIERECPFKLRKGLASDDLHELYHFLLVHE
jgi:hypothetical protein